MSVSRKLSMVFCAGLIVFTFAACQKEGPAEKAGKSIDQNVEKAGDKIDEAGKKIKESVK